MSDYYIIKKEVLPDYMENVLKAQKLINDKSLSITEACSICDISRSTFYKYKNMIYEMKEFNKGRTAQLSLLIDNITGSLNEVIQVLNQFDANIITINQSMPLNNIASIQVTIDISKMTLNIDELLIELKKLKTTKKAKLISIE
jgi:chorismate mutase